jgi:hypothetical protein
MLQLGIALCNLFFIQAYTCTMCPPPPIPCLRLCTAQWDACLVMHQSARLLLLFVVCAGEQ